MTQLCLRCGRHEYAGSFCSYCRTAEYDLVDHEHEKGEGSRCQLGAYRDPLSTDKSDLRRYLAKAFVVAPDLPIRHHPRTPGYTAASDPELPAWIPGRASVRPRPAHSGPQSHIGAIPPEELSLTASSALSPLGYPPPRRALRSRAATRRHRLPGCSTPPPSSPPSRESGGSS